jgi:hypothetical protein
VPWATSSLGIGPPTNPVRFTAGLALDRRGALFRRAERLCVADEAMTAVEREPLDVATRIRDVGLRHAGWTRGVRHLVDDGRIRERLGRDPAVRVPFVRYTILRRP